MAFMPVRSPPLAGSRFRILLSGKNRPQLTFQNIRSANSDLGVLPFATVSALANLSCLLSYLVFAAGFLSISTILVADARH
jgi:hypothetical protein